MIWLKNFAQRTYQKRPSGSNSNSKLSARKTPETLELKHSHLPILARLAKGQNGASIRMKVEPMIFSDSANRNGLTDNITVTEYKNSHHQMIIRLKLNCTALQILFNVSVQSPFESNIELILECQPQLHKLPSEDRQDQNQAKDLEDQLSDNELTPDRTYISALTYQYWCIYLVPPRKLPSTQLDNVVLVICGNFTLKTVPESR